MEANWDDLRLLLAVWRRGSLLQAGQLLQVAPSTVSRRLSQLEAALGEPLLERGVEGCWLTPRGQALVDVALAAEAGLRRQRALGNPPRPSELQGSILVSAGEGFASSVLEAARRLTSAHPGCSVELQVSAEFHKLARGVTDIAVRTAHLGEPSLIYRALGKLEYGVFASPDLLRRYPGITPATAPTIGLLPPLDNLPPMRTAKAAGLDGKQIRVNSFSAQVEAVRQGMGVAVMPRILAGDLLEVFAPMAFAPLEVYLVTRPQALKQPHIKQFFAVLEQVLGERLSAAATGATA
ncbi:LysR family transcriptional regulator [Pseudomonas protegens]|uniref:LysR family transcriptional regulator n=1 Tax=Pseudomonas protegens TaxID=380021 RepID=A0A2T6GSV0_9PSED|nr:LysR family transcriptional regulator [Pseudomonas protegens]PUA47239.1 LysR family transcriptional regulator [Pseudomonas protegens]